MAWASPTNHPLSKGDIMTKLESYLKDLKLTNPILCGHDNQLEIHMAQMIYLKCPRCGLPRSKGITHKEAQEVQNSEG